MVSPPHSGPSTVRNSHVEDFVVVLRVVERKLCHEQRQRSCEDLEDRWPSGSHNMCRLIYSGQCRILCVSIGFIKWKAFDDEYVISAASTDEILNSGVTVASIFFGKVFGKEAQRALTVFVALRYVMMSTRTFLHTCSSLNSALGNVLTVVRLFNHEHGVVIRLFIYLDIRGFSCESRFVLTYAKTKSTSLKQSTTDRTRKRRHPTSLWKSLLGFKLANQNSTSRATASYNSFSQFPSMGLSYIIC